MLKQKEKKEWPRYTSWFDRNEFKINVLLWSVFIILLFIARQYIVHGTVTLEGAILWGVLFTIDLFLLSFVSRTVHRNY